MPVAYPGYNPPASLPGQARSTPHPVHAAYISTSQHDIGSRSLAHLVQQQPVMYSSSTPVQYQYIPVVNPPSQPLELYQLNSPINSIPYVNAPQNVYQSPASYPSHDDTRPEKEHKSSSAYKSISQPIENQKLQDRDDRISQLSMSDASERIRDKEILGDPIEKSEGGTRRIAPRPQRFFRCESVGELSLELNSPIEVHQGPSAQFGISNNYFVHLLTVSNQKSEKIKVKNVSSHYLGSDGEWVSTARTSLATYELDDEGTPVFDVHNGFTEFEVQGNTSAYLAVSCVIEFYGPPASNPLERTMAHPSLPQPLMFRIIMTEQNGRQTKLLTEQLNPQVISESREYETSREVALRQDRDEFDEEEKEEEDTLSLNSENAFTAENQAQQAESRYLKWLQKRDVDETELRNQRKFRTWYQMQARNELVERERFNLSLQKNTRGNVHLIVRVRPLLDHEATQTGQEDQYQDPNFLPAFPSNDQIVIRTDRRSGRHGRNLHFFQCDRVFGPDATQNEVYSEVRPVTLSVMDGYNVCLMVYGQTGSGKTYTMAGPDDGSGSGGVIYNVLKDIITTKNSREADRNGRWGSMKYEITLAVMEIYNEKLFDLLLESNIIREHPLDIRRTPNGDTFIRDLTEEMGTSLEQLLPVLHRGIQNRCVGVSNVNLHSSRSHCIVKIHVCGKSVITGNEVHGTLFLVDLAGSERLGKGYEKLNTSSQFYRGLMMRKMHMQRETQNINRSLAALGDVIEALAQKKPFVPYRNSKLTYLLQNCMDGGAKMGMIINLSPTEEAMQETLSSLYFAGRVAKVQLPEAQRCGEVDE